MIAYFCFKVLKINQQWLPCLVCTKCFFNLYPMFEYKNLYKKGQDVHKLDSPNPLHHNSLPPSV